MLFLAVRVPSTAAARARIAELGELGPEVKTVRPDGLHLTLRYLGPTPPGAVDGWRARAAAAARLVPAFSISLLGLGAFPSPSRPRVLWLGAEGGAAELARLAELLSDPSPDGGAGPWVPHCTLARIQGRPRASVQRRLLALARAPGVPLVFTAHHLELLESLQVSGGPNRYRALGRFPLGGGGSPLGGSAPVRVEEGVPAAAQQLPGPAEEGSDLGAAEE